MSARPHAFRGASGLKQVEPRLHTLTLAISQCARINPSKITETYQSPYPSFSMQSEYNWSDLNSYGLDATVFSEPSLSSAIFHDHLLPLDKIHQFPPRHKAHLIPVEIFSDIFQYAVQADPRSQSNLMLVCRHWHSIMLSTPGMHSHLKIDRSTREQDVERPGKGWLLDVTIDSGGQPDLDSSDPLEFYACLVAAVEAASRWRSLTLLSFSFGHRLDLQIVHPLQHLESFKLNASCYFGNALRRIINAITATATSRFTVMEIFHSDAALYIVQPAHFQMFSSLTTLRLISRRIQNPVDILPSLHKLEIFEAHYLSLPIYPPTVDLPLTQVLRVLHLKSVSVQWMTGRIFPVLKGCSIIYPNHADTIQSVYMPSCSVLEYDSNNLGTLEHFHHPPLLKLEVRCSQWRAWRGNLQLVALHRIFAAQSLTCLHLEIKCSERLLAHMLELVPGLEELWMRLSSPHVLSSAFFLAFAAGGRSVSAGPSSQKAAPLCRKLKVLLLHYKRWSRGAERNGLIPAFGAIVASHPPEEKIFSFHLSIGEGSEMEKWIIHEPVETFDVELESNKIFIGVSGLQGIVPLSSTPIKSEHGHYAPLRFTEAEYITINKPLTLPIDFLFSGHCLKEVRMSSSHLNRRLDTLLLPSAPLFYALKVLAVFSISPAFFIGQTFHKLEKYQEVWDRGEYDPRMWPLTDMPVCTRLVAPLRRVATLKLPQIRELSVLFDHEPPHYLWEKHIAVNANLSGLKLLELRTSNSDWLDFTNLSEILGSVPALETLILNSTNPVIPLVTFLKNFVPMNAQGTSGLNRSSWKGRTSGVLCPTLKSLQIEGIGLTAQPELRSVLKDIVTLRAIIGSPLKSFTFYYPWNPERKLELIGRDGSFFMAAVVRAQGFRLHI